MHPAISVIFFTVVSGAGFGLFVMMFSLAFLDMIDISRTSALVSTVLALVLIAAGLMSSAFHLANPKNAWRAFNRFRTSWLSREGVFAVLFYPFAMLFILGVFLAPDGELQLNIFYWLMGAIATILAIITIFSTGMIYACLKTIRQWNTSLTPANYLLLGLMLGSLVLTAILAIVGDPTHGASGVTMVLLVVAGTMKAIYYFWMRTVTGPTINTATGFNGAKVRLLDVGHTAGTFLTDEFSYFTPESKIKLFKVLVFVFGFGIPLLMVIFHLSILLATLFAFVGIALERWLFFAEARHVVNLYHGAAHT